MSEPISTGTFDAGQLFSGWIYSNHTDAPPPTPVKPGQSPADTLRERNRIIRELFFHDAKITSPTGEIYVLTTGSFGTGHVVMGAPVPEPETYAMFLAGLGLLGLIARHRSNRQT